MKEMWNERYRSTSFAYGKEPNVFFKESLNRYNLSGKVLFPAEGDFHNGIGKVIRFVGRKSN